SGSRLLHRAGRAGPRDPTRQRYVFIEEHTMSRRWIIGLAAAALFAPSTAAAQEARARAVVSGSVDQGAAGRGGRVVAYGLETKITTGRPYSAEAVTETTQVLGDGNRIHNRS